jgi:RNA polymerase sigma factor (sigma-70 family)
VTTKDINMKEFMEINRGVLNNPIIKSFLENDDNYKLVQEAVSNPTEENQEKVDGAFKEHYNRVKLITYISKLIHFFSIDYDKKANRINRKYLLTLDQSISSENDNETVAKDLIKADYLLSFESAYGSTLKDHIENDKLLFALEELTPNQLEILELIYLHHLPIKDIALLLDTSPQNVSNQHRKALNKLKNQLI